MPLQEKPLKSVLDSFTSTWNKLQSLGRGTQPRKCLHKTGLPASLWTIFLIEIGGANPGQVVPRCIKKANWTSPEEQYSNQCSFMVSAAVPASNSYLNFLQWQQGTVMWNYKPNKPRCFTTAIETLRQTGKKSYSLVNIHDKQTWYIMYEIQTTATVLKTILSKSIEKNNTSITIYDS